jgi:hypothetical protein
VLVAALLGASASSQTIDLAGDSASFSNLQHGASCSEDKPLKHAACRAATSFAAWENIPERQAVLALTVLGFDVFGNRESWSRETCMEIEGVFWGSAGLRASAPSRETEPTRESAALMNKSSCPCLELSISYETSRSLRKVAAKICKHEDDVRLPFQSGTHLPSTVLGMSMCNLAP